MDYKGLKGIMKAGLVGLAFIVSFETSAAINKSHYEKIPDPYIFGLPLAIYGVVRKTQKLNYRLKKSE